MNIHHSQYKCFQFCGITSIYLFYYTYLHFLSLYNLNLPRSYQVRGHLAAQIDPIGLNNMDPVKAKQMIIRSVTVDEKVELDTPYDLIL